MKVANVSPTPYVFKPQVLQLILETQDEVLALKALANRNLTVPEFVDPQCGSTGLFIEQFLTKLHTALGGIR